MLRSLLFVPADSERKLQKALTCGADALVLDLEDSVTPERRPQAREAIRAFLRSPCEPRRWVRINPLDSPDCLPDLAAVVAPGLDGVLVPKPNSAADLIVVAHYLDALETAAGLPPRSTGMLAVVTETARALFTLGSYAELPNPRLRGVLWGAEDLSAALSAVGNTDRDGQLSFTYRMARSLCLAAAVAAEVQPIDTVYPDFRDAAGLRETCLAARREGFLGKIAIHPDQVAVINECFTPSAAEIAEAEAVIAAFAAAPGAGTVGLEGKMLDRPHLVRAERLLALARLPQ